MKFKTFSEWVKVKEMCGTGVVGPDPNVSHVDFQVWGAPGSTIRPSNPRKKKKKK
jgi:hypothetical protein